MKNTVLYSIVILLTSLALTACSSDDEGNDKHHVTSLTQMPSWQVNWMSDDERPDWQEPSPSDYENWAVMLLQLEDELKPYYDAMGTMRYTQQIVTEMIITYCPQNIITFLIIIVIYQKTLRYIS